MRRWAVVVAACVAAAVVAGGAATAAPTPAQLQRQIAALTKRVNALDRRVAALTRAAAAQAACQSVIPIAQYGGFNDEGYLYGTNGGDNVFLTTGLDVVPDEDLDQPGYVWMLVVDSSCVESRASARLEAGTYRRATELLARQVHARR